MKVNNATIVAMATSKKGTALVSLFRDSAHLVDNCILVNPMGRSVTVNNRVDGEMMFSNNGLNTFILTDIKK